jgi:hypothetical protein
MNNHPKLFVGVLTHAATKYTISHVDDFLACLEKSDVRYSSSVSSEDLIDETWLDVTRKTSLRVAMSYANLRLRWYLSLPRVSIKIKGTLHTVFQLAISAKNLFPRSRFVATQKALIRLRNISLGHLQLWNQALDSNADWVLILEDDATPLDLGNLARDLVGVVDHLSEDGDLGRKVYCDISLSFSTAQLGINISSTQSFATGDQLLFSAPSPFTNTLCAVLMSRAFTDDLAKAISQYMNSPQTGYLPIDWLVNRHFLRARKGKVSIGKFFKLQPGLYVQGSLE